MSGILPPSHTFYSKHNSKSYTSLASCFSLCCVFATPRGHEAYLRTGPHYDFDHYRQLVHEITQAFCGISKEVLEIKEKLHHDFDRPDLSEHIEKLQSKEKQKLELVSGHFRVTTPLKRTLHVK